MQERTIVLSQDWADCELMQGNYLNIIAADVNHQEIRIDNDSGTVIVDPEELIAVTSISESSECLRRTVLKGKLKYTLGKTSPSLLYGNILHSLFQTYIVSKVLTKDFLLLKLKEYIHDSIEDLYACDVTEEKCYQDLVEIASNIMAWHAQNVRKPNASLGLKIVRPLEIEERIWSVKYGLKGNVDVTTEVVYSKAPKTHHILPLELKTGVPNASHRAQTLLYSMMMADKYSIEVVAGLLVYLTTNETQSIGSNAHERRALLMTRNLLAHYFSKSSTLPPLIDRESVCQRCYMSEECFISKRVISTNQAFEPQNFETGSMKALMDSQSSHLIPKHLEFIKFWGDLIDIEQKNSKGNVQDLFTLPPNEREKRGKCLANLFITSGTKFEGGVFCHEYRLSKVMANTQESSVFSDSHFSEGDPIVISKMNLPHPVAMGYLKSMHSNHLRIVTDKPLSESQTFASQAEELFAIDKDGFASGMNLIRGNLYQMFLSTTNPRLRNLVVDLEAPKFNPVDPSILEPIAKFINPDQKEAILKVMSCRDYALILGMPGTGKTSTMYEVLT